MCNSPQNFLLYLAIPRLPGEADLPQFVLPKTFPRHTSVTHCAVRRWRIRVRCARGKRMPGSPVASVSPVELDLATLVWTRGADFPISRLECPRVWIAAFLRLA